jgi:hypothetical protein
VPCDEIAEDDDAPAAVEDQLVVAAFERTPRPPGIFDEPVLTDGFDVAAVDHSRDTVVPGPDGRRLGLSDPTGLHRFS